MKRVKIQIIDADGERRYERFIDYEYDTDVGGLIAEIDCLIDDCEDVE